MTRLATCLAALGLMVVLGSSAQAQVFVGNGWGGGYGAPGFVAPGYGYYGYGNGAYAGYPAYGYATGYNSYYGGYGYAAPPPLTANAMGPLMQAIRQTAGRRRGGR